MLRGRRVWKLGLCALFLVLLAAAIAEARPGGGHSSSGGGRSSSSSSSSRSSSSSSSGGSWRSSSGGSGGSLSGGGALGVVVAFVVIMVIVAVVKQQETNANNWSSGSIEYSPPPPPPKPVDISRLTARDPEFSRSVFEDFVFQLYAAAKTGRDDPQKLSALSAYLEPEVMAQLAKQGKAPSQVVIGSVKLAGVTTLTAENLHQLEVRIEATVHTEPPRYVTELWAFVRNLEVVSRPPTRNRTWPCPNCGAPWVANETRTCGHCNEKMTGGRFDWTVKWIKVESSQKVLASLRGTVEEYGNELPTVRAQNVDDMMAAIHADDPEITFGAICARTTLIYHRLNEAWNERDLKKVRGLVTASLRDYLAYWIDEYKRQGLHNRLDGANVDEMHLSKVTRDKHYDAITLRVFAGGSDYTVDEHQRVVGGSRTAVRRYTEYWTLIRSSARRGPVVSEPKCANCGAPLENTGDTGDCSHCNANNELGSFDWVLSKIEQDDNYVG